MELENGDQDPLPTESRVRTYAWHSENGTNSNDKAEKRPRREKKKECNKKQNESTNNTLTTEINNDFKIYAYKEFDIVVYPVTIGKPYFFILQMNDNDPTFAQTVIKCGIANSLGEVTIRVTFARGANEVFLYVVGDVQPYYFPPFEVFSKKKFVGGTHPNLYLKAASDLTQLNKLVRDTKRTNNADITKRPKIEQAYYRIKGVTKHTVDCLSSNYNNLLSVLGESFSQFSTLPIALSFQPETPFSSSIQQVRFSVLHELPLYCFSTDANYFPSLHLANFSVNANSFHSLQSTLFEKYYLKPYAYDLRYHHNLAPFSIIDNDSLALYFKYNAVIDIIPIGSQTTFTYPPQITSPTTATTATTVPSTIPLLDLHSNVHNPLDFYNIESYVTESSEAHSFTTDYHPFHSNSIPYQPAKPMPALHLGCANNVVYNKHSVADHISDKFPSQEKGDTKIENINELKVNALENLDKHLVMDLDIDFDKNIDSANIFANLEVLGDSRKFDSNAWGVIEELQQDMEEYQRQHKEWQRENEEWKQQRETWVKWEKQNVLNGSKEWQRQKQEWNSKERGWMEKQEQRIQQTTELIGQVQLFFQEKGWRRG